MQYVHIVWQWSAAHTYICNAWRQTYTIHMDKHNLQKKNAKANHKHWMNILAAVKDANVHVCGAQRDYS